MVAFYGVILIFSLMNFSCFMFIRSNNMGVIRYSFNDTIRCRCVCESEDKLIYVIYVSVRKVEILKKKNEH